MAEPTAAFLFAAKLAMDAGGEASMPFQAGSRPANSDPGLALPTGRDFMHYAYNNPIWRAARATGRFLEGATDPKNFGNELSAGVNAATAGAGGAAPAADPTPKPPVAQTQAQAPDYGPAAMYGLGGAGAGALLGAAMGRKGTRGRNALIGGALGGGAGLLAQHLMNKKTAGFFAPAEPITYNPNLHKMLQQWEQTKATLSSPNNARKAPATFLGPITQGPLNPELVQALNTHMKLPKGQKADEMDAVHTLLELEDAAGKKVTNEKQALVGTTLGVLGGAVSGRPGKRLSAVGRGAVKGLGVDVGAAAGGTLGAAAGGTVGGLATLPLMGIGAIPGAALGGIGGAVTGGRLGYNVTNSMLGPYISDEEKFKAHLEKYLASQNKQTLEPTPEKSKTENKRKDTSKKEAAFDFGKMLGNAGTYAKDMYNKVPESVRSGAGMGGVGGAALGGLAGLVAPGETNEYDEFGRVVGRKQRNRFGAMMRGAVGGGLAGAAGGAAAGHFAPQQTQQTADYFRQQGHNLHQKYLMSQLPRQELPAGPVA
jgi:hypothetical protein